MATYLQVPQWFDNNGFPLAGGKFYAFEAGTTTPKAVFTDVSGTVAHPNPLILDASGRAQIWMDGAYKIRVDDANDVTVVPEIDNLDLAAPPPISGAETFTTAVITPIDNQAQLSALNALPSGPKVLGVTIRVNTTFGTSRGLSALSIGWQFNENQWGTNIGITGGTTTGYADFTLQDEMVFANPTDLLISALGGPFDAVGQLTATIHQKTLTPV